MNSAQLARKVRILGINTKTIIINTVSIFVCLGLASYSLNFLKIDNKHGILYKKKSTRSIEFK
jgi:hypothetical protein